MDLLSLYAKERAEFDRERDCLAVENFNDAARMQAFLSWTVPRLLGMHDEIVSHFRNLEKLAGVVVKTSGDETFYEATR